MDKIERIRDELSKFHYIQYTICDINGFSRGKILPVRNATDFEKGLTVNCGTLILGHKGESVLPQEVSDRCISNMAMVPDLDTFHPIPWAGKDKYKVAEFYCDTLWLPELTYQEACPRYIAKRQMQKLQNLGFDIFSAFEMEFILLNRKTKKPIFDNFDYCLNRTFRSTEMFLFDVDTLLFESGVEIGDFHLEYGPGKIECALKPQWGIKCPDATFGFTQGLFEIAEQQDMYPSFIPKTSENETGIGTHFNHSLWRKERKTNCFHDSSKENSLSDITHYWIGGLTKHVEALTAICCPTVNCYRRLFHPRIPGKCFWDIDNRNATFRLKNEDNNTYIENRIPSGKCNPYLVFAATIAAGIDGIVNKIECPPLKQPSAKDLPATLSAALDALKKDDVMVSALSQEFVDWFVQLKTETEITPLRGEDAPKNDEELLQLEIEMYE